VDLDKQLLEKIVNLILSHKKPEKVVLFGSRAEGSSKKTSDIDIAVFAKDWTSRDFNIVKNCLEEEIATPLKFDVVNFYGLTKESLKTNILKKGRVIYEA